MENNQYVVKIGPEAVKELDEISDYISENSHNKEAASNLMNKIESGIKMLNIISFSHGMVSDQI